MQPILRIRFHGSVLLLVCSTVLPAAAWSQQFVAPSIVGSYVMNFHGTFSSTPPPFTGEPLDFEAAMVGRLTFDGSGQAYGEYTLTFHNVQIPFQVRSRFAVEAAYTVEPDGHLVVESDEYRLDESGTQGATPDNSVIYECYLVRTQSAECLQHTLISYQQGPDATLLPLTMSGSLQRQQ